MITPNEALANVEKATQPNLSDVDAIIDMLDEQVTNASVSGRAAVRVRVAGANFATWKRAAESLHDLGYCVNLTAMWLDIRWDHIYPAVHAEAPQGE